ncbi:MAG: HEPN domain-containing protein [Isosphaeraceae bacterium]|nr:HEPN domain-containing protein [Isosphaeraceae bacterium]
MAIPTAPEARLFYRTAYERFEDARLLMEHQRTTGSIYLAGFAVECILKSLILSVVPESKRSETMALFRGHRAHDFEWLRRRYVALGKMPIPEATARRLTRVQTWTTDIRYLPRTFQMREVTAFYNDTDAILTWADGRL